MEFLQNGYTLHIAKGCFPLSTDSILLADFVNLPKNATVLDLGSGCCTIGTLLCAKDPSCQVNGIEIDPLAHETALENIARNDLGNRLRSTCSDLRQIKGGKYHICVSNPPYYPSGPASKKTPTARREDNCSLSELISVAAANLRYGGDFYLVHKPERLAEIIACGAANQLEAKLLRLVHHRKDGPISLILLKMRKGGNPGLIMDEKFLHEIDGTPSDYYKTLYHLE